MRPSPEVQGGKGSGITFVDMEYGWLLNHEDLVHQNIELMSGRNIDRMLDMEPLY